MHIRRRPHAQLHIDVGKPQIAIDEQRPLACRLFPLFLHFKKDGTPRVRLDTRAKSVCPLCSYGLVGLRAEFVSAAKDAYAALMKDGECAAFLRALDDALRL